MKGWKDRRTEGKMRKKREVKRTEGRFKEGKKDGIKQREGKKRKTTNGGKTDKRKKYSSVHL